MRMSSRTCFQSASRLMFIGPWLMVVWYMAPWHTREKPTIRELTEYIHPTADNTTTPPPTNPSNLKYLVDRYRNADFIFYNRFPKCASSTTLELLSWVRKENAWSQPPVFKQVMRAIQKGRDDQPWRYYIDDEQDLEKVKRLIKGHTRPFLVQAHVNYIDFSSSEDSEGPVYINMIRDPLARLVSFYYFLRFSEFAVANMTDERRHMTYDECVSRNDPECTAPNPSGYFTIIPYFCGHAPMCRRPSQQAFETAKRNVQHHFAVVGIQEMYSEFLEVLDKLMPHYFSGIVDLYDTRQENNRSVTYNMGSQKNRQPSASTTAKMEKLLHLEYEFYNFIKEHFIRLYNVAHSG